MNTMATYHYITRVLKSGQPRPYADSEFEWELEFLQGEPAEPRYLSESGARRYAELLPVGFVKTGKLERSHGLLPYLDYFAPVESKKMSEVFPKLKSETAVAYKWRFKVVYPFCD